MESFDYIITGGGCAGLSLAYRLAKSPKLRHKRILLIERGPKSDNDRTWCFWEKSPGPFESIVCKKWQRLSVFQSRFKRHMDIRPYTYKMILGSDFYEFTLAAVREAPNMQILYGGVEHIRNLEDKVEVRAGGKTYLADWCFNSIPFSPLPKEGTHHLDQHFRGWFIKTDDPVFDPGQATLMDFRIPQHGETRFLYVLPANDREALVELAIFSNRHLQNEEYDRIIGAYLKDHWPGIKGFSVDRKENGVIPMTDLRFPKTAGRIVQLGTVGGQTRASTGYTFWYIQQHSDRLLEALENNGIPSASESFARRRSRLYDRVLLQILKYNRLPGDELFARLWKMNHPAWLLKFLNAETSLPEEMKLMATTPVFHFLGALGREIFRKPGKYRIYPESPDQHNVS